MPIELMHGHKSIMPREESFPTWVFLSWEDNISRERLLEFHIQQLGRLLEDMEVALERLKAARLGNKERFDKTHRLRMKKIEKGDWMLVFDSTLEHQHSTVRKFARRWFGPYVVERVNDNATYLLRELDGTMFKIPIARNHIKVFWRTNGRFHSDDFESFLSPQTTEDNIEDADEVHSEEEDE